MRTAVFTTLLLSAVLVSPVSAQMNSAQMNHDTMNMPQSMPGMTHTGTEAKDLAQLKGKAFDRAFLSMMVVHHQGAIDMSKAVVNNVRDAQVKMWANDIIKVQQQEIGQMNTWLRALGGPDKSAQSGMAGEMNTMLAVLKRDKDSDRALVTGMLPHHASAIEMARVALQNSDDARILGLAREIIRTQADEMYAYRQWLLKRGS